MQTSKHATDIDDTDAAPARSVPLIHGQPGPALIETRVPPQLRSHRLPVLAVDRPVPSPLNRAGVRDG
jgi:hypothetical protein